MKTVRRISRVVTDPSHVITEFDSIETAIRVPAGYGDARFAGRRIGSSQLACNIAGAVGLPAAVFFGAGLKVWEDWLAEVEDRSRITRWIGKVFGGQSLWPEDKPV